MSFTQKVSETERKEPQNLARSYIELAEFVIDLHGSSIAISDEPKVWVDYNPINGDILDDYKALLNCFILNKTPHLQSSKLLYIDDIGAIFKKYNLPQPKYEELGKISNKLSEIADKMVISKSNVIDR